MLQELDDESENQGLKMNKSKTKLMMDRDAVSDTKDTETKTLQEESRPDGQYSPSTATSSRVTLEHD